MFGELLPAFETLEILGDGASIFLHEDMALF